MPTVAGASNSKKEDSRPAGRAVKGARHADAGPGHGSPLATAPGLDNHHCKATVLIEHVRVIAEDCGLDQLGPRLLGIAELEHQAVEAPQVGADDEGLSVGCLIGKILKCDAERVVTLRTGVAPICSVIYPLGCVSSISSRSKSKSIESPLSGGPYPIVTRIGSTQS